MKVLLHVKLFKMYFWKSMVVCFTRSTVTGKYNVMTKYLLNYPIFVALNFKRSFLLHFKATLNDLVYHLLTKIQESEVISLIFCFCNCGVFLFTVEDNFERKMT